MNMSDLNNEDFMAIKKNKIEIFRKYCDLRQKGIVFQKEYDLDSPIEEIEMELQKIASHPTPIITQPLLRTAFCQVSHSFSLFEELLCREYLKTLSEKESKAYHIAKSHLGPSFQLEKSNGFLQWKKEYLE